MVLLVLAACSQAPEPVVVHAPGLMRNPTAPVASQVDATAARLAGDWRVIQSSRAMPGVPVAITGDKMKIGAQVIEFASVGQGRFTSGTGQVWVHWLDADNRTVALGDPKGTWFAILDRSGRPGERLRAAREILDWYGYDLTKVAKGDKA